MAARLPLPFLLLVAWPYYPTLRHHSLLPTDRLAECDDDCQLQKAIEAWRINRGRELYFVKIAVSPYMPVPGSFSTESSFSLFF